MKVPILKQNDLLIASIQASLSDADLGVLRDRLLRKVGEHRSRGVLIDLSAVDVLDSFASHTMSAIAQLVRLRGAETVVVGIQPDVALAMVQLGVRLEGVRTALDLEDGLRLLHGGPQDGSRRR